MVTTRPPRTRAAWLVVLPFALCALLLLSARWFWLGDLAASLAWHIGWVELALASGLALVRAWRPALVLLALAALHAGPELRLWIPLRAEPTRGTPTLTLAVHNLLMGNRDRAGFETWLRASDPDVVVLSEVSPEWRAVLADLAADYPHQLYSPADEQWRRDTWGTAILSRTPFEATRLIEPSAENWRPPMEVRVVIGGRTVTLRGVHALRPGGRANIERRNATLRHLAAESWDESCLLAGDLNVTSSVPVFRELLARTGLSDSRLGFGRQPTFRTSRPLCGLEVAIDHVLVGDAFRVLERRTETVPGSDHRAVITVLAVLPPERGLQSAAREG